MLKCRACGAQHTKGAAFCSACGARLSSGSPPTKAVRKAVTVLFTDVAGFTPLTERVDPERLRRVMSHYFETMRAVIERHGGTVEKFIGDAIMAVFGIPRLHEDDALRAVRAGLEMREALVELNRELDAEWGITLEVRTGINTGEVVTGQSDSGDALVLGDAVNVAARLEQSAPPQEILLGPATYRLVKGAVEAEELAPVQLKGKGDPITAYRLVRVVSRSSPRVRRLDTPLVGRADEMSELRAVYERVAAGRTCHLVTLLGPAGVGKTRLVAELVRSLGRDATVVQGQCPSYGEGITFWPAAEVVREAAGVLADDSLDEARAKLAVLVEDDPDAAAIVDQAGQLLGLTQETVGSEEIFWAVRRLLENVARDRPLVVVLEDVHWAQPTFLDLVEYIVDWSRDAPILICCTARPELLDRHPKWCEGRPNASRLHLDTLSDGDSTSLIRNLLQRGKLAERARARIVATARGNPLYLEEMLSMLIDDDLLRPEDGGWVLASDLQDIRLPLTLQSVVASRLDLLDPEARQVIEVAAVMGTRFSRSALFELIPDQPHGAVRNHLRGLLDKELLGADASGVQEGTLVFHHALTREAAYGSMSKEARADLHERFADWLEATGSDGPLGPQEEVLGYHLEHAFLLGQELKPVDDHARTLARRGGEHLASAGRRAFARGDVVAAENLLSRALALLPAGGASRLSFLPNLSEALMMLGELGRAEAVLEEAHQAAAAAGDRALEANVQLVRTTQRLFTQPEGWADQARRDVERAIPVFEEVDDHLGLARSWRLLGLMDVTRGQWASAGEAMDRAAAHARSGGDRREELESLCWLPLPLFLGPLPADQGLARCQEIIERAEGDNRVEANVLLIRGTLEAMRGDVGQARQTHAQARSIYEDLGLRFWIAGPLVQFRGWVELLAGDPAAAEQELRAGYEALQHMGESSWLSTVAGFLGQSRLAQGDLDEAERFAVIGNETAGAEDVYSQVVARGVRTRVLCRRGEIAEAEALGQEAVTLAAATDCLHLHGDALLDLAEARLHGQGAAAAAALADDALRLYLKKGNELAAGRLRAQLSNLAPTSPTIRKRKTDVKS